MRDKEKLYKSYQNNNIVNIILPIHNESKILDNLINNICNDLNPLKLDYKIIICENGSTDNTLAKVKRITKKNKSTKLLTMDKASYGKAIKYGISRSNSNYTFIFNADLWDINFFKESLFYLNKNYDLVIGSKRLKKSQDYRPLFRQIITFIFNLYLKIFLNFEGTDTHGLKGFRTCKIKKIAAKCKTTDELFDTELVLLAQKYELKIKEIPIKIFEKRPHRTKLLSRIPKTLKELYIMHKRL